MRHFGLEPKAALVSHSIFGSSQRPSAQRMRDARALLARSAPELPVLGEVHGDAALSEDIRRVYQGRTETRDGFAGSANLLVMPSLDAANILFNVLKVTSGKGVTVGPILLGAAKSVHILSPSATVRRIVNMTALAVAEA
jgi:malate dehydrogenase (oxaloacetate-decarboxylating)(NADP+)